MSDDDSRRTSDSTRTALHRRNFMLAGGVTAALPMVGAAASQDEDKSLPGRTPHTRFAVNIEIWFQNLSFPDRIRAAADMGYEWIEFWNWRGRDLDAIRKACDETGVRVAQFIGWGFVPGLNDPANHDAFEKAIKESCEAANRLGAGMLTVVGGNDQEGMTQDQMHENIVTGLRRVTGTIEKAKVMLILEPMNIRVDHKGHCLYGSQDAIDICRKVGSPWVKINWDVYHLQIMEGDLARRIREGFDEIGYIQIADNPGRNEPGTGEINYTRVFQELASLGYDKPVGLECWPVAGELAAAERIREADTW